MNNQKLFFNGTEGTKKKDVYLNAVDPISAVAEAGGKVAEMYGKGLDVLGKVVDKKSRMEELKSERQREKDSCSKNKAFRGVGKKNKIASCQSEVDKRYDLLVNDQKNLMNRQLDIQEMQVRGIIESKTKSLDGGGGSNSTHKTIAIAIASVVLLGIGAYFLTRKK
jgi:hypothetical protein